MKNKRKLRWFLVLLPLISIILGGIYFYTFRSANTKMVEELDEGFDKPQEYYKYFNGIRTPFGEKGSAYKANYAYDELNKALKRRRLMKSGGEEFMWTHRGPGNVGGRTRSLIIDPDDPTFNTWFAGSASGGVWKTTNGGESWESITDHFPNLATNCIVMAPSDHDILYIGTGEGYGGIAMVQGNGMFKSIDRGQSWTQISSTIDNIDFFYVNDIIVDQSDPDLLLVATNTGIFKTSDGGNQWEMVYADGNKIQDLVANPLDHGTLFAGVNSVGVIKSYDQGNTWLNSSEGLMSGFRYAVDVSRVDTNYIFVGMESGNGAQVFISTDGGDSWRRLNDANGSFSNYMNEQGWYNNEIKAHPFEENKVFAAGVAFFEIEFLPDLGEGEPEVISVDTVGTSSFLGFINFGGPFLGGGMSTGTEEGANVEPEDYSNAEIRFGPGLSQKAYRFTVPEGEGPGVPSEDYTYHDYVDVPFVVWDTDNDRQLMVSFRDQERDGEFNLIERSDDDDISGREYIFVQGVEYSETPDDSIARDGGHYYKMTYFFWPTLAESAVWDPENLPDSKIIVEFGIVPQQDANTRIIAGGSNQDILHVDHHDIQYGIIDEANEEFMVVEGNDGGLGVSWNNGSTFNQVKDGYLTAQVYGVAKMKFSERYLIGMQDNGSWLSRGGGEIANSESEYDEKVGGDGFEVLWHPIDKNKLLASIYYNQFRVSVDYGETWRHARMGIKGGDGPFVTRVSNSPDNPDLIFAISGSGVYRHTNFGIGNDPWELINLGETWTVDTSQVYYGANVKVSLADPGVVWAGSAMRQDPDLNIFVSKDYGLTFDPVNKYGERDLGYISGMATHPTDPATAYVLFSIAYHPKILRTTDYGETWEDLSGFGADSVSSNGFPDVAIYSLLVHEFNPEMIWAGTEIGIFESVDNGETWYYADNGMPAVSIWQMFLQDNQVIVATYGRGIWSAPKWPGAIETEEIEKDFKLRTYPNPSVDIVNLSLRSSAYGDLRIRVFNNLGQQQLQFEDSKISDVYEGQFDLSKLTAGNYVLLIDMDGQQYSSRFIME